MDDMIVMGRSFQEHLHNLHKLFEKLRKARLTLKPSKCAFLQTKVSYIGHIFSRGGVSMDPVKIGKVAHATVRERDLAVSQSGRVVQAICS